MTVFLSALRLFWPYLIAFALGGVIAGNGAWQIQGQRLTSAEQRFTQYKQDQTTQRQAAQDAADKQRKESEHAHFIKTDELKKQVLAGDVFRRCVDAGKCGRVQQPAAAACSGVRLPSAVGLNGTIADTVPARPEPAADSEPEVIGDCAITTLQLNDLQADIEAQPHYKE